MDQGQMPRSDEAAVRAMDGGRGARIDSAGAWQGVGLIDGTALPQAVGVHAAKTSQTRHAAFTEGDQ